MRGLLHALRLPTSLLRLAICALISVKRRPLGAPSRGHSTASMTRGHKMLGARSVGSSPLSGYAPRGPYRRWRMGPGHCVPRATNTPLQRASASTDRTLPPTRQPPMPMLSPALNKVLTPAPMTIAMLAV